MDTLTNGANSTISSAAGKYYLWTKVTDRAGNRATSVKKSNQFTIGGWQQSGSYWYYYSPSTGGKLTGWQYVLPNPSTGTKFWYYLDPNNGGRMLTGWQSIGGYWYYLIANPKPGENQGAMVTGWYQIGSNWYYLKKEGDGIAWSGPTGSMLCSNKGQDYIEIWIVNKWYKFNSDGVCLNP